MIRELNPFLCCFRIFFQEFFHQSAKDMVLRVGTKRGRFRGLEDAEPKLPSKYTRVEDVLGCFIVLVAKRTMLWIQQSPLE